MSKLKKFTFTREVAGYCRGYETVTIEAETEEKALELAEDSYPDEEEIIRDDRERENWENKYD